jgi:hypothetical protein
MTLREWWHFRRQHSIFGDRCKLCRQRLTHRSLWLGIDQRIVYICERCSARVYYTLLTVRRDMEFPPEAWARYETRIEH